ncbi:MAG: sugar ABC transporter ATP-binding protein [Thermotogaceae bacterium]|nr:sugar ABC transporter ATP-binding protein [Thermotogaceae bacterium]
MKIVEMISIRKEFPGVVALDNIDFALEEGEIHGLVGENGAGKSTLINVLAGVFQQSSGEMRIFGEPVRLSSPSDALRRGIGVVYQDTVLDPYFTSEENIWLGREPSKLSVLKGKKTRSDTKELCEEFGIEVPLRVPVGTLSVAKQKMVEILRALSMNSKVLVLDEPTASITQSDTDNLFKILRNLKKVGISVIFVSHHLDEVFNLCDRITVLRNGHYEGTYASSELSTRSLIKLMTHRDLTDQYPKQEYKAEEEVLRVSNLNSVKLGLKDISFEVKKGEIVGFFGMVGSGRTELMKSIFGAGEIDGGEILIENQPAKISNPSRAMKTGIYLCPEDRRREGLVQDMSVVDNLSIPFLGTLTKFGVIYSKTANSKAKKLSKDLEIKTPSLKSIVSNLSGGNQQKVVLGKWLMGPKSRVFIFDEPTQGIDVGAKTEFYKIMQDIASKGCGVIFVSSDIRELIGVADRIYVMRLGKITAEFEREEFDQSSILENALSDTVSTGSGNCE